MIRYYITDRYSAAATRQQLLDLIIRNARSGCNYIQIREKDWTAGELVDFTRAAVQATRSTRARILVNDRLDCALAAGAHGVQLRSGSIPPAKIRAVTRHGFIVSVSCHSIEEVAAAQDADFLVFGPVFEVPGKGRATGLDQLARAASISRIPVLALGGVDELNAPLCLSAGATGFAGIRAFQRF